MLDAPYAPTLNLTNTQARTAQQIMLDVLTVNGVSLGWAVQWGLVDWLIPAGVFSHQGSYIGAINKIAAAAVTRHGQTVGYFIPTQGQVDADIAALKKASKTLDQMLTAHNVDIDAVVADFKVARKSSGTLKKPGAKAV